MKGLQLFIKDFLQNRGLLVFLSLLIEKMVGLVNTIFVVRMISASDYGIITLIATAFAVAITLVGLGATQGLLRYGTLEENPVQRRQLLNYIFHEGLKRHLLLIALFIGITLIYEVKYDTIWIVIAAFAIRMLGYYFYLFISSSYRIEHDNKKFAQISIVVNLVGLLFAVLFTYFLGKYGYLLALALGPWVAFIFYKKGSFDRLKEEITCIDIKSFWNYSFNSSVTYFFSELLFMVDVFLIGILMNENAVANYKLAIILPMNLLFIPSIFMQTDYPKLVTNSTNKSFLNYYISNYYKIFIPLCTLMLIVGFILKDWVVPFVFGKSYEDNGWIFFSILIGTAFNMCFRNLYGNLLAAVGLANKNSRVSIFAVILMLILSLVFIPLYGILGAAMALTITFVALGILSAYYFRQYLKQLNATE